MSSWLQPGVCERLQGRGVVLGFIGSLSRTRASADVLNALLDLNVFGQASAAALQHADADAAAATGAGGIEAFHDSDNRALYLLLEGRSARGDSKAQELFLRSAFFLFTVCHHVVVLETSTRISIESLNLLKKLQYLKLQFRSSFSSIYENVPVSCKDSYSIVPSLSFVYSALRQSVAKNAKAATHKRLQRRLSMQYMAVIVGQKILDDRAALFHVVQPDISIVLPASLDVPLETLVVANDASDDVIADLSNDLKRLQSQAAKHFETVSKSVRSSRRKKDLPSLRQWSGASLTFMAAVFSDTSFLAPHNAVEDVDALFWENEVSDAIDESVKEYLQDLPPAYSSDVHESKSTMVLNLLLRKLPAPLHKGAEETLKSQLNDVWTGGRRLCGAFSVNGQLCEAGAHIDSVNTADAHHSALCVYQPCRCGRQLASYSDCFSVSEANAGYLPCCKQSLVELDNTIPGWSVHLLDSTSYFDALRPIDIKDIEPPAVLTRWDLAAEQSPSSVFVGFEYWCRDGHRFLRRMQRDLELPFLQDVTAISGSLAPPCDIPIFDECKHCQSSSAVARLGHIYLATPSAPVAVKLRPFVTCQNDSERTFEETVTDIGDVGENLAESNLGPGVPVPLPPDSLLSICLPFVFSTDGVHHLSHTPNLRLVLGEGCLEV